MKLDNRELCEVLSLYNDIMVNTYPSPESVIEHKFSDDFESRMRKLIRSQQKPFAVNTKTKRILIVALITIMMLTACSIPAIREPIVNFVVEIYEDFTTLIFPDTSNESETIVLEKASIQIPDGYTSTEVLTETSYFLEMKNAKGSIITFEQVLLSSTQLTIDTEDTTYEDIMINNFKGVFYHNKGVNMVLWSDNKYNYMISGDISKDELISIANTVE